MQKWPFSATSYRKITIQNPQNATTYSAKVINLTFSAHSISFFPNIQFYYSLDRQERIPISVKILSEEAIPINPGIYIKNVTGEVVVGNLSEGWHNVTVYDVRHLNNDPQNEEITYSASAQFQIRTPELSIVSQRSSELLVAIVAILVVSFVLFLYRKKRKSTKRSKQTSP